VKLKTKSAEGEVTEDVKVELEAPAEPEVVAEEPAAEPKEDKSEALAKRLEEIERKNQELEAKLAAKAQPAQQPQITASDLRALPEDQREALEKHYGRSFDEIVRLTEQNERYANQQRETELRAKLNVRDAMDEVVDKDPQLHKAKAHIREYLEDVSDSDKADPAKLKRHMDKAVIYARGKAGVFKSASNGKVPEKTAKPDESPVFEDTDENTDVKSGTYNVGSGLKLNIEELPKEIKSKLKNGSASGQGVMGITFKDDEAAKFR